MDFRPGTYKHYKRPGNYVALFLTTHHETDEFFVVYVCGETGRVRMREWASPGKDSWSDLVNPDTGQSCMPYSGAVRRFQFVGSDGSDGLAATEDDGKQDGSPPDPSAHSGKFELVSGPFDEYPGDGCRLVLLGVPGEERARGVAHAGGGPDTSLLSACGLRDLRPGDVVEVTARLSERVVTRREKL